MSDCVICLREASSITTLICSHSFCEDCIQCWLSVSNKCPLCAQVVSESSPVFKHEGEQISPHVDYSNDIQFLQRRLCDAKKRVYSKHTLSQNLKSNVSKADAQHFLTEYRETEQLFNVFTLLAAENTNNSQTIHLLETINFKLLDLQQMLQGGVIRKYSQDEDQYSCEQDYEDDYPKLGASFSKFQAKVSKPYKAMKNRTKNNTKSTI